MGKKCTTDAQFYELYFELYTSLKFHIFYPHLLEMKNHECKFLKIELAQVISQLKKHFKKTNWADPVQ